MKKSVLLAATATLSAGLIGFAAVASASGPSSSGSADVSPASSSTVELRHGADDPATHDVGNDHRSAGSRADDVPAVTPAPTVEARHGADDPVTHDAGDDHGVDDPATHDVGDDHGGLTGGHGADDPAGHDAGDDHGGHGGHGSDD